MRNTKGTILFMEKRYAEALSLLSNMERRELEDELLSIITLPNSHFFTQTDKGIFPINEAHSFIKTHEKVLSVLGYKDTLKESCKCAAAFNKMYH